MFNTNISLNFKIYCNRHQPIYNWCGCEQFMFTFTWRREEPNFYIPWHPCVRSVKLMNWCHDAPATICQRYELARDSVHALSSDKGSGDIFERLFPQIESRSWSLTSIWHLWRNFLLSPHRLNRSTLLYELTNVLQAQYPNVFGSGHVHFAPELRGTCSNCRLNRARTADVQLNCAHASTEMIWMPLPPMLIVYHCHFSSTVYSISSLSNMRHQQHTILKGGRVGDR